MSWGTIIGLTALTAVATGLLIGILRTAFGFTGGAGGAGAATGIVAALLITRRRQALAARSHR
ncbi:MAG: hypothetical protein ACXWUG_23100 [Polyangiales bacterium]